MFGDNLKRLREAEGLTQEELGSKLNLLRSSISMYENNIRIPSVEIVKRIADYFGVSMDYIVSNDDPRVNVLSDELLAEIFLRRIKFLEKNDFLSGERLEIIIAFLLSNKEILLRK